MDRIDQIARNELMTHDEARVVVDYLYPPAAPTSLKDNLTAISLIRQIAVLYSVTFETAVSTLRSKYL
jgi:hypothetical protein